MMVDKKTINQDMLWYQDMYFSEEYETCKYFPSNYFFFPQNLKHESYSIMFFII